MENKDVKKWYEKVWCGRWIMGEVIWGGEVYHACSLFPANRPTRATNLLKWHSAMRVCQTVWMLLFFSKTLLTSRRTLALMYKWWKLLRVLKRETKSIGLNNSAAGKKCKMEMQKEGNFFAVFFSSCFLLSKLEVKFILEMSFSNCVWKVDGMKRKTNGNVGTNLWLIGFWSRDLNWGVQRHFVHQSCWQRRDLYKCFTTFYNVLQSWEKWKIEVKSWSTFFDGC